MSHQESTFLSVKLELREKCLSILPYVFVMGKYLSYFSQTLSSPYGRFTGPILLILF